MNQFRKLLFPFSVLYHGVTAARNSLYSLNILESKKYDIPIICVGNLSVGGTGKSPMIEYLLDQLGDKKVATLSRGYKRESKGFQLVALNDDVSKSGDEPLQFKNKFPDAIVAVDADRQNGIAQLQKFSPDVILLDDAFQHRKVQAGFQVLLTRYDNLYTRDLILPAGNLRESRAGMKRANMIVVTKCPDTISEMEMEEIKKEIDPASYQKVFFSSVSYADKIYNSEGSLSFNQFFKKPFHLVTGIANPQPLVKFLETKGAKFQHLDFPDHHAFSEKELAKLNSLEQILTTEKDYMRLRKNIPASKLFYLPIKVKFLNNQQNEFNQQITDYINKNEVQ